MGKKDIRLKTLEELNDVFADIVNVLLFDGKQLVKEDELTDTKARSNYSAQGKIREQERDVSKYWNKYEVRIALIGLENQEKENDDMPIRMIGYDGAAYRSQVKRDDRKETKQRYPVISLVLYFGYKNRWRAPVTLRECFEIDEALLPYVSDYRINLFEIAYLSDEQVQMFKSDFRFVADYYVQMRKYKKYDGSIENIKHVSELLSLMSAITDDHRFENEEPFFRKKGGATMCEVLDRIEARGMERGMQKGMEKGRAEGMEKGMQKGMQKGKLDILFELVHDGVLTIKDAAARAGVSTSTFSRKMKANMS